MPVCLFGGALALGFAQSVISARSGLINHFEGEVFLNEEALVRNPLRLVHMDPYDVVRAGATGRAEILVTPEAFLRVRQRGSVRLLSDSVAAPRFELLSGSMILEVQEAPKGTNIGLVWKQFEIAVSKRTIFRLDSSTGNLMVIDGEVNVEGAGAKAKAGRGRLIALNKDMAIGKFDRNLGDAFDHWSARRSQTLARTNLRNTRTNRDPRQRGRFQNFRVSRPGEP